MAQVEEASAATQKPGLAIPDLPTPCTALALHIWVDQISQLRGGGHYAVNVTSSGSKISAT
jgi:hypothetical protein